MAGGFVGCHEQANKACAEIGIAGREEIGMILHQSSEPVVAPTLDHKQQNVHQ